METARAAHHRRRPRGAGAAQGRQRVFPCDLAVGQVQGVEPPRFIGFIRDITARKDAEEQLRRSEAELRLAQELANLGNYVIHAERRHARLLLAAAAPHPRRRARRPTIGDARGIPRAVGAPDRPQTGRARVRAHGRGQVAARHRVPGGAARRHGQAPAPPAQAVFGARRPGAEIRRHDPRHHRPAPRRGRGARAAGAPDALQPPLDHGRDGRGPRARDQPAAVRDRDLRAGLPAPDPASRTRRPTTCSPRSSRSTPRRCAPAR